jgi:hypothetical protein
VSAVKTRKGDLILVERIDRAFYTDGRGVVELTSYVFGVVASATRDGVAKACHSVGYGDDLIADGCAQPLNSRLVNRFWVLSAKDVDVTGVLRAAKAHHWPGHPGQPMPFDSLDEAKSAARPYLIRQEAGEA